MSLYVFVPSFIHSFIHLLVYLGGLAFTSGQIGTALLLVAIPVTFLIGPCARVRTTALKIFLIFVLVLLM